MEKDQINGVQTLNEVMEQNSSSQKQAINQKQNAEKTQKKFASTHKRPISAQQMLVISKLYTQHKSKWSLINQSLTGRTESELKNFFYNSLRKLGTRLGNIQKSLKIFQKNVISSNMLRYIIDMAITVKNVLKIISAVEYDILLFRVKDQIFSVCFEGKVASNEQLKMLSKAVRRVKYMYKNVKMNQKHVKTRQESIRFAKIILQKQFKCQQNQVMKQQLKKNQEQYSYNRSFKDYQISKPEIKDKELEISNIKSEYNFQRQIEQQNQAYQIYLQNLYFFNHQYYQGQNQCKVQYVENNPQVSQKYVVESYKQLYNFYQNICKMEQNQQNIWHSPS